MRSRSLVQFARFKPLTAWSISGAVLGIALAGYLTGWNLIALGSTAVAVTCVVLMQYVAHPLNDIMDYDLDKQAPIGPSGRFKPIVDGDVTMGEAKWLSSLIILVVLVLLGYLVLMDPVLALPALYGVGAVVGYNHPSFRLAYHPFTELYLAVPINTLAVVVISYIGSGTFSEVAVIVGVVFAFAATSFFVSMMSMDFPTDRANGKRTTVVALPRLRYCTLYPLIGLTVALAAWPFLLTTMGLGLSTSFMIITTCAFLVLAWYGSQADDQRLVFLEGKAAEHERSTHTLRLQQLYASIAYAFVLSIMFAVAGGI